MGALFGTDGIRGVAGEHPLDGDTVYRVGYCLTEYLQVNNSHPRIIVGRDTRISGPWLEALLRRAIRDAGGVPDSCGVLSTPAVALLTTRTQAQAGIMISASHNPYQDNGIKVFSSSGMKFNDAVEALLEQRIASTELKAPPELAHPETTSPVAILEDVPHYHDLYALFLIESFPGLRFEKTRIAVDCAPGSLSAIAPGFLRSLGADVISLHCEPDGRNINLNAGALHLERLQTEVVKSNADVGIAFDGDADRAMFVDRGGKIRDGDDVLYMLARFMDFEQSPRIVVGTVMANLGLEYALRDLGIQLVRTSVGDRYVLEEMLRLGAVLGGEQSGHVILTRFARTGDGLLTALSVLQILQNQKSSIEELCSPLSRLPQILMNVRVREKVPFEDIPGLRDSEAAWKERLGPRSRILLRYSGTEKLARIMVEGEDEPTVRDTATSLASHFK